MYGKIENIDFRSAKARNRKIDCEQAGTLVTHTTVSSNLTDAPTEEQLCHFMEELYSTGAKSANLTVKKPYNDNFVPGSLVKMFSMFLN